MDCGPWTTDSLTTDIATLIRFPARFTVDAAGLVLGDDGFSMTSERSFGLCLLGNGIVGSGVVKILTEQRELLRRRTRLTFDLRHIVVRDPKKHAGGLPVTTDAKAAIDDPKSQIVIELMGGTGAAA